MYLHAYVCIRMYMYAYVCICLHTCIYVCTCMYMYVYVCICMYMYVYVCECKLMCWYVRMYVAVDLNSFICKRPLFANEKICSRTHVYLSRGCSYPLLCCWDALDQHANSNCVRCPADSQGQMEGHAGKIPAGNSRVSLFTTFPWLVAAKVLCGLLASMDTFSFATAFAELSRNFRKTLAKSPLQINRKIHTLNRGLGFITI